MAWISPTSHVGFGSTGSRAYDGDTDTYASAGVVYSNYATWFATLTLKFDSPFLCNKIRTKTGRSNSDITKQRIYVGLDSSYTLIYEGSVASNPGVATRYISETTIDSIKISFYFGGNSNPLGSQFARVYEIYANTMVVPTVTTDAAPTAKDHNSATLGGEVTATNDEAITERGIEYKLGEGGEPLVVSETDDDFGADTFTLGVTSLSVASTYYYRAYAVNSSGTGYGDWVSFTTDATSPIVETLNCTNIGATSVTANGNIINKGGATVVTRGFCYIEGTTGDPTTADDTESEGAGAGDYALGTYSLSITGLTPATDYRIRAYAVNSEGTSYGETVTISGYTFTENADTYFTNFYDKCYIVNGKDDMVKYDGDLVSTVGITPPSAAPSGSGGGTGGSLGVGNYLYAYTYVDKDGYESNASPTSAAIEAEAGEKITLTIANSSDPKVVSKRIYRSLVGLANLYYEGEIADNTTTTYISSKADTALTTTIHADHNAPPTACELISKRLNRIYLTKADDLIISKISDVEYFPPAWFMKPGLRQDITGIIQQTNALLVTTENSIERLVGTDEDNFQLINSFSEKGNYAPRSLVMCYNNAFYLGYDGIYYFDGEVSKAYSLKLNEYLKNNVNYKYIDKSSGIFVDGKYILSYPKGTSTINSESVYVDIINNTFGIFDFAFSCYSKWDRFGDGLKTYGGSTTEGFVYEINKEDTYTDNSTLIECYDKTDFMDFGYPERWKQFYNIYIKVESDEETLLTMYYTLDDNEEESKEETIEATTKWYKIDLEGGGQRGRSIQLRPSITSANFVAFHGYAIVMSFEAEEY